jgi:hypothetical protein
MSENAGAQPAAQHEEPTGPPEEAAQRAEIKLSVGNGVLQQFLNFIKDMSAGNRVQTRIAVCISMGVGALLLAAAVVIVIVALGAHNAPMWLGYATLGTTGIAGSAAVVKRARRPKPGK